MILDNLKNCSKYEGLNSNFAKAFDFLKREDLNSLAVGKYELDGENIFALVQEYETKTLDTAIYEAHKKYIDIQYLVEGIENMGYQPIDNLVVSIPYDKEKDFMVLSGETRLTMYEKGEYFILFPEDGHMPGVFHEEIKKVKKVVIKVAI